jgi:hypothetical protein
VKDIHECNDETGFMLLYLHSKNAIIIITKYVQIKANSSFPMGYFKIQFGKYKNMKVSERQK